jgi:enoyl-CoA hydratase/carnithine racemase
MSDKSIEMDGVEFSLIDEHIALVTLCRSEVHHAINGQIATTIEAAVKKIEAMKTIRVAIICGAGERAFCSGADLKEIEAGRSPSLSTVEGGFAGFVFANRSKPWIAAVGGVALGGGAEIALACDIIVATENASFGFPEVRLGLVAAAGGAFRLPRSIPRMVAAELLLTGEQITAKRAYEIGLINRLVPKGAHLEVAIELARKVALAAPEAVRETLSIARAAYGYEEHELRRLSEQSLTRLKNTQNFDEGARAFIEKRLPIWQDS